MNQSAPLATAVLISLSGEGAQVPSILGKILPVRQVEYAAAQGCSKVILLGRGALSDAIAVRHAAEGAGLRLVEVSGPHGLAATVAKDENLLILQNNILPAWKEWTPDATEKGAILTLPASAGRDLGFERIDLARAWAGALVVPGKHLSSLHELPEDAEAAPALLRIALQARLPEHSLDEAVLSDGSWSSVTDAADLAFIEDQWLAQHAKPSAGTSVSELIAGAILTKLRNFLFSNPRLPFALLSLSLILAIGGVLTSYFGQAVAGFGLLGLAAFLNSLALVSRRLREVPFERPTHWPKTQFLLDIAFLATAFLSLDGGLEVRIFLPFVLLAAFHSAPAAQRSWQARMGDRTLVFLSVGVAGILWGVESALMLVSSVLLALNLLSRHRPKG